MPAINMAYLRRLQTYGVRNNVTVGAQYTLISYRTILLHSKKIYMCMLTMLTDVDLSAGVSQLSKSSRVCEQNRGELSRNE